MKNEKIINGKVQNVDEEKKESFIKRHRSKLIAYAAGLVSSIAVILIKGKFTKSEVRTDENDYDDYDEDEDNVEDNEERSEAQE